MEDLIASFVSLHTNPWWSAWHSIFLIMVVATYLIEQVITELLRCNILIVEDCEFDQLLYKNTIVRSSHRFLYFKSLDEIKWYHLIIDPVAVIADNHLEYPHLGRELVKYCKINEIPVAMVTSDHEVEGVPPENIITKQSDAGHLVAVSNWLNNLIHTQGNKI